MPLFDRVFKISYSVDWWGIVGQSVSFTLVILISAWDMLCSAEHTN